MVKQLNEVDRAQIFALFKEGYTSRTIAKKIGVSQSTVSYTIKKVKLYGTYKHSGGNGRPSICDEALINSVLAENKSNSRKSLRKIAKNVKESSGKSVSHATVRKVLNDKNIFAYSPRKKPMLSTKNIKNRLRLAEKWIKMPISDVKKIIFSDETKINLYYNDGKCKIWREPGQGLKKENIIPTVKFGGVSIMVWGVFFVPWYGAIVFHRWDYGWG